MPERDRDKSVEQWLRQTPVAGARVDDCLDAETLAAWSEGLLEGRARSTAEAHAASCARCQAMLAIMVRTTPAPAGATGSPFRKWLMMLSPAMAAAAAVALWVAVGQRPASPVIDELTTRQAKAERAAEATQAAPAPASGVEKEGDRKAPGAPLDREAPQATADARAEFRSRTRTGAGPDTGATAPGNERTAKKDVASARRADKSRDAELRAAAEPAAPPPPPAPTPTPPAARPSAAEGVTASAARPPVTVAPPGPAPLQQANQPPNQVQNQVQNQAQNQAQAGQRQQAGAVEERVIVTGEQPLNRTAADSAARGGSGGRGGAAGGFADAPALKTLANAGPLDIAVPESSIRWRIADGRTIQRSLDSGVTWANHHTAEKDLTLIAGAAPSSNVCWLVGRAGAIILTIDGRAWRRITFPEPADLAAVTASDARTATVTTADGRQFATTDSGRTWTRR